MRTSASAKCRLRRAAAGLRLTLSDLETYRHSPRCSRGFRLGSGGGHRRYVEARYAAERGIDVRWIADPRDLEAWASAIDEGTRFVFGDSPSNPSLALVDVPALAGLAHARGLPFIVDPTVATPALLRPLTMGADVVVQSLSKAIGGSGLSIGGR